MRPRCSLPFWMCFCAVTLAALAAIGCQPGPAPATGFAGTWIATTGGRVMMVLTLREQRGTFGGSWAHPDTFSVSQSSTFSAVTGRVTTSAIKSAVVQGTELHLTVQDEHNPNEPDEYVMALENGGERAAIRLVAAALPPWPFSRYHGSGVPSVSTDWDASASYKLDGAEVPSSAEMLAIFDEDQKVRQNPAAMDAKAWEAASRGDKERRTRTATLLEGGQLHSGPDLRRAAFVFQHGDAPDDYLLAHTLALAAMSKGDADAAWIAAATLDRYLQSIHQSQIYGTQFLTPTGKPVTQDPFNRTLIPDSLRSVLGVASLAAQKDQLAAWRRRP